MDQLPIVVVSGLVFILALVIAWKITWLLLKIFFWLIALGALASVLFWCVQNLTR